MASSLLERKYVNLYYLASKTALAITTISLAFFKNAYLLSLPFLVFILVGYLLVNFYLFHKEVALFEARLVRSLDYLLFFVILLSAKNFYGVAPISLVLILYSVIYWSEILVITIIGIALLIISTTFRKTFDFSDLVVSVFFLLAVQVVASKWNILRLIKLKMHSIQRLKATVQQLNKELSYKETQIRLYEEAKEITEKLSKFEIKSDFPRILANLLNAQKVEIKPVSKISGPLTDSITVNVGKITLIVVPKYKFLLQDKRYREKLNLVAQMIKPYLESFLAKSK